MNIKKFLIFSIIVFVIFVILIIMLWFPKFSQKGVKSIPTPFPVPTSIYYLSPTQSETIQAFPTVIISLPPTEKVIISGITVNNFFPKAQKINQYGDYSLVKNEEYKILYETQFNLFLISIISSPFEEVKKRAEGEFMRLLGIKQADACKLKVSITTPLFANPDEAGKSYKLSFCEK